VPAMAATLYPFASGPRLQVASLSAMPGRRDDACYRRRNIHDLSSLFSLSSPEGCGKGGHASLRLRYKFILQ